VRGFGLPARAPLGAGRIAAVTDMVLSPDVACTFGSPTIAVLAGKFKRQLTSQESSAWVGTNYQIFVLSSRCALANRCDRSFGGRRRPRRRPGFGRRKLKSPAFGFRMGNIATVSRTRIGSIRRGSAGSITPYPPQYRRITEGKPRPLFPARSSIGTAAGSSGRNRGRAVSAGRRRAGAPTDAPRRARTGCGVRRLRDRVDLGDEAQVTTSAPLNDPGNRLNSPPGERARGGS
jgi:hypothetical protein